MAILDPSLIAELSVIVGTVTQGIKSHPDIKGKHIPVIAAGIGLVSGVLWYATSGSIFHGSLTQHVNWVDAYRGVANGTTAGVTASTAYNVQKALPIPNLLQTKNEMIQAATTEEQVIATAGAASVGGSSTLPSGQGTAITTSTIVTPTIPVVATVPATDVPVVPTVSS